ncbi:MAG: translation initiation factor IF-2 [Bacteroidota bacterium]
MADAPQGLRLSKIAKEFNIGIQTILDFLKKKGHAVDANLNAKVSIEVYDLLVKEFQSEKSAKEESKKLGLTFAKKETLSIDDAKPLVKNAEIESAELLIKDRNSMAPVKKEIYKASSEGQDIKVPKVLGKIDKEKLESQTKTKEKISKKEEGAKPKTGKEKEEKVLEKDKKKKTQKDEKVAEEKTGTAIETVTGTDSKIKVIGKMDIDTLNIKTKPHKKTRKEKETEKQARKEEKKGKKQLPEEVIIDIQEIEKVTSSDDPEESVIPVDEKKESPVNFIPTEFRKLDGPTILGKMELPVIKESTKKPVVSSGDDIRSKKKKRKRIKKEYKVDSFKSDVADKSKSKEKKGQRKERFKPVVSEGEIEKQIKETLARLSGTGKSKASKYRRQKREMVNQQFQEEKERIEGEKKNIKVTEFVTVNELANMMHVPVTQIISTCMNLGLFVSINQRMDAETLTIIADEFGYNVEFVSVDVQEAIREETDHPEEMLPRAPIVTVMGHVDHGKTSLLDYIRKANVIAGEAGGITQHIGAYEVQLESGKRITFLDTPGHEAFTAMRARGAKVTDIVIIVVAADDSVMPQTIEAINHATAAGVPIVFAINKIDKPNANVEKIKEQLANLNYLVEDWGGKYQSQEISAKKGVNIDLLLEKVLLEAELLDLKANPEKLALGAVIESSLDKGRGYVAKVLVQNGTLKIGDMVLAGYTFGRVKAMFNERNQPIKSAGPSAPLLMLGLNGAPQAGDRFNVMTDEHEVKNIATKRLQLQREQGLRTQKHITLDEIGRRIAIGDFKELNIIVKGDVDGSIEALTDALLKQSTEQVQVNVIHKSVGQISESDVLLASASNAIIIGFQVRPSMSARKLAEQEQIDIRLYSIIYNAINELKSAIEGMHTPEIEEKIICNIEIREVYKITKVGSVAGCMVLDGKITRNTKIRIIRDGIVVYTGLLGSLKRFKDDVKDVSSGYECGLNIANFNDIKVGDIIEGYEEFEVKRKL